MAFQYADYSDEVKQLLALVFTDDFMKTHSRFESFESFRYSSAVFINWGAKQLIYDDVVFNNFVKESTQFLTWDDMVCVAVDTYFSE